MALTGTYTVNCALETLSQKLFATLWENFEDAVFPVTLADQTSFSGRDCRYQTDTYQIYSYMERGRLTVNLHFFQPGPEGPLSVKTAVFSPVHGASRKGKKIFAALEAVILAHSAS